MTTRTSNDGPPEVSETLALTGSSASSVREASQRRYARQAANTSGIMISDVLTDFFMTPKITADRDGGQAIAKTGVGIILAKTMVQSLKNLKSIIRNPAFLLTTGLVGWCETIFTIEWSFPYCSNQEDGPASAVFGLPLPYIRYSGVSSLEYFYMPSILILNLLILFIIAFPLVSWAVKRVASPDQSRRRSVVSVVGLVLLLSVGSWNIFLLIHRIPVSTVASGYETYSEFRPIRFSFKDLHYDCTPSNYWFKDGRGTGGRGEKVVPQSTETNGLSAH